MGHTHVEILVKEIRKSKEYSKLVDDMNSKKESKLLTALVNIMDVCKDSVKIKLKDDSVKIKYDVQNKTIDFIDEITALSDGVPELTEFKPNAVSIGRVIDENKGFNNLIEEKIKWECQHDLLRTNPFILIKYKVVVFVDGNDVGVNLFNRKPYTNKDDMDYKVYIHN